MLIESETEYCNSLNGVETNFRAVKQISVQKYQLIQSNAIFRSLGRGVAVLIDENQLFAYMNSYGNMHYEKLIDAFKTLPNKFFNYDTNIVDWGCGQAMASMAYFDYLNQNEYIQKITKLTLIEPSEIALRRAALHIKKFSPITDIDTVNKDLDALTNEDFKIYENKTHLHLFSNILDIEQFSLSALLKLIQSNFTGDNYFICVSPYINDTRTSRLDAFVNYFSKMDKFELVDSIDNKFGEWKNSWTRVIRVFKVVL